MRILLGLLSLTAVVWSCIYCTRHSLPISISTVYGKWTGMQYCPSGMYVSGMQIKYQWNLGTGGDDTALNGVKLFCNRHDTCSASYPISSGVGPWGSWQSVQYCPSGQAVIGYALLSYLYVYGQDNVGVVNFAAYCGKPFGPRNSAKWLQGNSDAWGQWRGNHFCPDGYLVCGIESQIDSNRYTGADYHGFTSAKVECCKVTDIPCTPSYQILQLASYDNLNEISSSGYSLISGINSAAGHHGGDPLTASSLNSMVQSAVGGYAGDRTVTVQVPRKTRATIKQLYLTCGVYRIALSHTFEEGTKKPGHKNSHVDDDDDSEDDC